MGNIRNINIMDISMLRLLKHAGFTHSVIRCMSKSERAMAYTMAQMNYEIEKANSECFFE